MATASSPDPSEFALSIAVGYAHVLNAVLGSLERASSGSPVFVLLALPVLMAYLVAVTLAFAFHVAADGYAHVVASGSGDATMVAQAAALSPAAVMGWFASTVVKLAVALLIFSVVAVALFHFSSVRARLD